jgi:hypothetical protein
MMLPVLASCSKPPEYGEIEERFRKLVEASYEINDIFFGEGLPTYERVTDPKSSLQVRINDETGERLYFYEIKDEVYGRVIAYRKSYVDPYTYVQVKNEPAPTTEGLVYSDEDVYCYRLTQYKEPVHELYYSEKDPADYDYVRMDSRYHSINEIKAAAEQVYSKEYLASIYDAQFVGTVAADQSVSGLFARYMEYTDDVGNMSLMKSNAYEPLIKETRLYLFETAKIVKPSNKNFVTVSVDSYLPSKPSDVLNVTVTMVLQDGVWMLDCATY